MRTCLLLLCCLAARFLLPAQDSLNAVPQLTLKLNATQLINLYKSAASLGVDLRVSPGVVIDAEGGMFLGSAVFANHIGESYRGLRLRGGVKIATERTPLGYGYVGPLIKYNNINHRNYANVLRQGGQYQEDLLIDRKVRSVGFTLRAGWQFFPGKTRRFFVEPMAGIGVFYHRVSLNAPPDAMILQDNDDFFDLEIDPGKSRTFNLTLGLYIGYAIW